MGDDSNVKILVLGPCNAGKTTIANFLAAMPRFSSTPTVGVRIVEIDREVTVGRTHVSVSIELWDVSGEKKYEYTWPAISSKADGILFVYPNNSKNAERDLEAWHARFAVPLKFTEAQMAIFSHSRADMEPPPADAKPKIAKAMAKIPLVQTSIDDHGEELKEEFDNFVARVIAAKRAAAATAAPAGNAGKAGKKPQ